MQTQNSSSEPEFPERVDEPVSTVTSYFCSKQLHCAAAPLPASECAAGDTFLGDTYARRCAYLRARIALWAWLWRTYVVELAEGVVVLRAWNLGGSRAFLDESEWRKGRWRIAATRRTT